MGGAVDYAELVDGSNYRLGTNIFDGTVVRGDEMLLRFRLVQHAGQDAVYAIPQRAGLELVISENFQNTVESTIQAYSDDTQFNPADWDDFARANGKVSCRVDLNTINLANDLGAEDSKAYYCALVMTPETE